ncbi:hypothetical protein B0F90DRAFT_1810750 [Multifurca ochricompacta]|uniref:Bromodomain associated domain-containing protein n=1 Tax=Multifurca ochricompacta TaxID=376703 RepID=A0AAD4M2Q9_9AGAM|nr:hypothetical protein B0F90DRAFT_1810750 [Multifurca ochricompacta]
MDAGSHKLLETVVLKTLHAHSFTRSSSQASLTLTDLLSHYIILLATTCSKYAQHAGRLNMTVRDAMYALDELGVSMDELHEYCGTEGDELARYSGHSAKRQEDLSEFKASLAGGLPVERESIPLVWAPFPESYSEDVEEEDVDEEVEREEDVEMLDVNVAEENGEVHISSVPQDIGGRQLTPPRPPSTPPLPLSPVSNPTSPTRKRPRTESWKPPPHIPSFLPPFPVERSSPEPESLSLPPPGEPSSSAQPPLSKIESVATLARVSSANPADYTTVVPYSLSNLASTPEWHLPSTPRESRLSIPQIQPSLLGAYHHILTHPPPASPNVANPSRHRVAMKNSRWEPADSLYVAPVGPSYAVPTSAMPEEKKEEEKDKKLSLPGAAPRPIGTQERIVPLSSYQTSRIPELAREALSGAVLSRITRLSHPTVLQRGPEKLTYGTGVPAPWNSDKSSAPLPMPSMAKGKELLANGLPNGKGKEGEKEQVLPDARLFATWEHEQKSFRDPIAIPRRARQGSVHTSLSLSNVPGRARGESRAG